MSKFQSLKAIIGLLIVMAITVYLTMLWLDDIRPSFSSPSSEVGVDSSAFSFDDLLDALRWVESKDGRYIYGDYKKLPADWEPKESYPLKKYGRGVVPIYCEWDNELGEATYFEAQAVGDFQIHKIYVDDVNRIIRTWRRIPEFQIWGESHEYIPIQIDGENIYHFRYEDRYDKRKSRVMVWIYLRHYGDRWHADSQNMLYFEYCARLHNGGPTGWKKDCTKPYWEKVKARLETK